MSMYLLNKKSRLFCSAEIFEGFEKKLVYSNVSAKHKRKKGFGNVSEHCDICIREKTFIEHLLFIIYYK